MDAVNARERFYRTVRLDDDRITAILNRLDARASGTTMCSQRRHKRYTYRQRAVVTCLKQPGATKPVPYLVPTRNLSEAGLSFLHGGFVHIDSRCVVLLITLDGSWVNTAGTVVRCRYIESNLHEVAVRFDDKIDLSQHCCLATKNRVLVCEPDRKLARLIGEHLTQFRVDFDHAVDLHGIVETVASGKYDVVLLDVDEAAASGCDVARELRTGGYAGVIVAITRPESPGDHERCLHAGCDLYLCKPFGGDDLFRLLGMLEPDVDVDHIHGASIACESARKFLESLPTALRALEEALLARDYRSLERHLVVLRRESWGGGFDTIAETIGRLADAVRTGAPSTELHEHLDALVHLCLLARLSVRSETL